jgi:hypothetical protein
MAGEEPRYEAWLRTQPCAKCGADFSIEVHHALWGTTYSPENTRPAKAIEGARKGKGQKAHSFFSLPLCIKCHIPGIHRGGGHFSGMSLEEREAWERELHPVYRQRFAMQCPPPAVPEPGRPKTRKRIGSGWTVATIRDWLRKEAPTRPAPVAGALTELANLIEEDTL